MWMQITRRHTYILALYIPLNIWRDLVLDGVSDAADAGPTCDEPSQSAICFLLERYIYIYIFLVLKEM